MPPRLHPQLPFGGEDGFQDIHLRFALNAILVHFELFPDRHDELAVTEYELLRIISFLEKVRSPYVEMLPFAEADPAWNILFALMKAHLRGREIRITGLAAEAGIPHATAIRRIGRLIEEGHIVEKPIDRLEKGVRLVPSEALNADFVRFAKRIKGLLAETFGLRSSAEAEEDYYFGGSSFAAQIIPPPQLISNPGGRGNDLRFLLNDDNYFRAMRNMWADFRLNLGSRDDFELLPLSTLYDRVHDNAARATSNYDIVAIDMPWLGDIGQTGAFRSLDGFIENSRISPMDFHPSVWGTGTWNERQYGIPIYCTVEVLAARSDWFERDEIKYPTTFSETIEAARHFHNPQKSRYGIVWNAAQGRPIAQTFMILMACCGRNVVNTPRPRFLSGVAAMRDSLPDVLNEAAFAVMDYLHRLRDVSPPNILDMGWDQRTHTFLSGGAALSYCWTVHAARFEYDLASVVKRRVRYLPQPRGPSGSSINPIGGYLLCVPANLPEKRAQIAFDAIAWMTSPEAMKAHVQNGFPLAPRFSVSADPEAAATSPVVSFIDKLAKRNLLSTWPRPAVSQYVAIENTLGVEIHRALRGDISDRVALENVQREFERVTGT